MFLNKKIMWESRKEWCVWIFVFSHHSFCNRPGKWRVVWTWRNSGRRLQLRCSLTSALPFLLFSSGVVPKHNFSSAASRSVCPRFIAVLFLCLESLLLMSIACASVALFGTKFPHILLQWYSLKKKEQLRLFVWFRLFGICFHSPCDGTPHTQSLLSVMLPGSSVAVRNLGAALIKL